MTSKPFVGQVGNLRPIVNRPAASCPSYLAAATAIRWQACVMWGRLPKPAADWQNRPTARCRAHFGCGDAALYCTAFLSSHAATICREPSETASKVGRTPWSAAGPLASLPEFARGGDAVLWGSQSWLRPPFSRLAPAADNLLSAATAVPEGTVCRSCDRSSAGAVNASPNVGAPAHAQGAPSTPRHAC